MAPQMWLYRKDEATFRTIQRSTDDGVEVLVVGSTGDRAHHTFSSGDEALVFREGFETLLGQRGFRLTWMTR
jgi:high-affinity Fe2+/Pb2+ permease